MIKAWIQEHKPQNKEQAETALREIMQEVALAGLQRAGFFEKAAFYGGTALRIFYGLDRFSEDLDFSLLEVNPGFTLEPYFEGIITEFKAIGMHVSIKEKRKAAQSNVESAFLKSETVWKELVLEDIIPQAGIQIPPSLKIKLEVDREPPLGFDTEEKLLLRPFSFYVKCFSLSDLFAGKCMRSFFANGSSVSREGIGMTWNGISKKVFPCTLIIFYCGHRTQVIGRSQLYQKSNYLGL